jgi:hypothetical protein
MKGSIGMNLIKELEDVLNQPHFMGIMGKTGINLAVNAILDKIDNLGLEIVEKKTEQKIKIEEMLKEAKLQYEKPYQDEWEQGSSSGRVDALEEVLELFEIKI